MNTLDILNLEGDVRDNPFVVRFSRQPDEAFAMMCSAASTARLAAIGEYGFGELELDIPVRVDDVGESCDGFVITRPPTLVLSFVRGADEYTFVLQLREVDAGGWVVSSKVYALPAADPPHWGEDEDQQTTRTSLKQLFAAEAKRQSWFQEFPVKLVE